MPRLPKWIGDTMEAAFSSWIHPVEVIETEYISELLKRVRFASARLKKVNWIPGQEIEFRVNDHDFRHYTPFMWDATEGYTDVLLYLHGQGPGSRWAEKLLSGQQVKLMGPVGKLQLDTNYQQYVFLGDESTIGLFYALQKTIPPGSSITGVIECEEYAMDWPAKVYLNLPVCKRIRGFRGHAILKWLDCNLVADKSTIFYLCGHAESIQLIRKELLFKGFMNTQIKTKPYWSSRKRGL